MNRGRFWPFGAAGFALFVLLVGSNLPTPLFPVYAKVYGLSPLGVTLLFATYTLLVIPALLVFGPLSDVKGRRELLIGAILVPRSPPDCSGRHTRWRCCSSRKRYRQWPWARCRALRHRR